MSTCMLNSLDTVSALVGLAQENDEPLIVLDGADECLVAMRPAVFERMLFESDLVNCFERQAVRL